MAPVASQLRLSVALARSPQTSNDADGFEEALSPSPVFAAIQPLPAGSGDQRSIFSLVTLRYHPQVSVDTIVTYGTRKLYVRNVQNVDERNAVMNLYCEEIQP